MYKNFLATGNSPVVLDLNTHLRTLITGKNGEGKSTFLSALTFALYGKDFRGINKPGLINSINKKNLEVEVEFTTQGKNYKIRRGLKPNICEIYMDGNLIKQSASPKDHQKYIEENVLHFNFNTFKQLIAVGTGMYVPFMRLPKAERREIIEELLDLQVFSRMNIVLKNNIKTLQESLDEIENSLKLEGKHDTMLRNHLIQLRKEKTSKVDDINAQITSLQDEISSKNLEISGKIAQLTDIQTKISKIELIEKKSIGLGAQLNEMKKVRQDKTKRIGFFSDNSNCPTCFQIIADDFKEAAISKAKEELNEVTSTLAEQTRTLEKMQKAIELNNSLLSDSRKLTTAITSLQSDISSNESLIANLSKMLNDHKTNDTQEVQIIEQLRKIQDTKKGLEKQKSDLLSERELQNMSLLLLKDTGIKAKIIQTYVPVINKLINMYLASMDFYVNFELDEQFAETIKSRYRDEFIYENFSEGEKQRIDLAILFAWRHIAFLKNNMSCNLLVLDETFDNSLDTTGQQDVMKILMTLKDTNVFLISHRMENTDMFDRHIKVEKKKNFTTMEVIG